MTVVFSKFPKNLDEFKAMPFADMKTPENTCAMFLCAVNLFANNKSEGTEAMNILRGPRPMLPYDVQFLTDRLRGKKYLPMAYFKGARPDNNYKPDEPVTLEVIPDKRPQDIEEGYIRVFLETAGADSPRPVKLRRKGDMWCLWEYSSVLSGIRIPKEEDPWA